MRGLGRHLELKELARRQKEEQAEREKKAWCVASQDPARKVVYTIPKPFKMTHKVRESPSQLTLPLSDSFDLAQGGSLTLVRGCGCRTG